MVLRAKLHVLQFVSNFIVAVDFQEGSQIQNNKSAGVF